MKLRTPLAVLALAAYAPLALADDSADEPGEQPGKQERPALVNFSIGNPPDFRAGYDNGFFLESDDGNYRMTIGGWIQARYEFERQSNAQNVSRFDLRRARLDIRGHVITEKLTFRLMPEFAGTAALRDAWIDYQLDGWLQIRAGQFTVPFQWHRDVGARRHHFAERGEAGEIFGIRGGRDIGLMFHGSNPDNTFAYAAGVFSGTGRIDIRDRADVAESDGMLGSARVAYAILGQIPDDETDSNRSDEPGWSVGAGVQGANRNNLRNWANPADLRGTPSRGDYAAATADTSVRYMGASLSAAGYYRYVDPQNASTYDGWGYELSAGYALLPELLEVVGRFNQSMFDTGDGNTRERAWGVGLNLYHHGHDWKTRINYLDHDAVAGREQLLLVEHHLQF